MDIIVTIDEQEAQILESWLGVGKIQEWVQNALDNKVRQRVDASICEVANFDLSFMRMTKAEKLTELAKHTLPTRTERDGVR